MNSNHGIFRWFAVSSLLLVLTGCGSAIEHTELIGEVSLDGVPVEEAHIYLAARSSDFKSAGTYNAQIIDGTFEFTSNDGPPPGDYELILKPVEEDSEEVFERIREKKRTALAGRDQFLMAVARKGTIRVSLSSDDVNVVTIDLTSR